ncbi:translocase of chloroplast 159, chloroplastic isoform X2 [Cornus florida]|uniref:translocase of chloroplast 159, chloroplastic isoform X2 n=1 Tax=Cornus florida TaxID=4283 RepID=UPI00289A9B2B|nr:translocase of chloroplast 159, chloroplastic isoform X2 [Cornus florida]
MESKEAPSFLLSNPSSDSKATGVEGFVEKPKILQEAIFGEKSNLNELLEKSWVEVLVGSNGDKVAENPKSDEAVISEDEGSLVAEEVGVEGGKLKGEEAVEDMKLKALDGEDSVSAVDAKESAEVVEKSAVQSGDKNQVYSEIVEPTDSTLVKPDDEKFTTEGDSIVENIHVNLLEQGVAVVGEMEENKDSETEGVVVPVNVSVKLMNGSDQRSDLVEEAVGVDSDFDKNIGPLTNHNVETTESEVVALKSDSAYKDENLDVGAALTNQGIGEGNETQDFVKNNQIPEIEIEPVAVPEVKMNESTFKIAADEVGHVSSEEALDTDGDGVKAVDSNSAHEAKHVHSDRSYLNALVDGLEDGVSGKSQSPRSAETSLTLEPQVVQEAEAKDHTDEEVELEGSLSDGDTDGMIFGSSEAAKQFIEELERGSGAGSQSGAENFLDHSQRIDGQIVTDSDEEVDTDEEGGGKELFDSAALAALLKAATGAGSDSGNITITSQDGSRLFSVERPAGLGSSLQALRPAPRPNRGSNLFSPSSLTMGGEADHNLSEEEKKKLEQLQLIRVKFLRLVQRLGRSPEESIAAQVLYRLALVAGRQTNQLFSLDAAKRTAMQFEAEGKDDLNFSVNILVLGKSGVGKSATINSIFSEEKALIHAFEPATTTVKEISGMVDGVKIRVFDTPGLKSSILEQAFNRKVLSSINKFTKKNPPDIVLYVDRLDTQTRDLNDLPLLRTITSCLGPSIWRSSIVTLTHAASAPPDGPSGSPLSYEVFVSQRSHVVQQSIGQAVGDLRMMSPSLMNPVSLVENHPSCRKNRDGQKVLPNGQSWRPQLLLLCYSMKMLSEASSLSKPQDPFDHRKLFGFRVRSPPLAYMLSSMLQSRAHPKLSTDQSVENGDSDIDLADLSDSDQDDDDDEYDQLPPFKPLRKSQIAKLSKEQRKAYFEEYDYRVKLLRKKQWQEECKRMREMKKKGKDGANDYGYMGEDADQENFNPAPVPVPLPDMALPPTFDGDNPSYRYRFLEPTSQFLARPVLDTHGWDHDCGYDGVNLEQSLAIASQFPAAVSIQMTKDKKEFTIHLDSSVAAKHGENGSSMVGFDIQNIGKQLAYIVRGETKLKNLKKNKTAAGISVTFLGENVATGLKIEDQLTLGKQWVMMGSAGTVRCQGDAAYGANLELQHRELDYPIGPVQSTYSMNLIKWRGDWAMGFNTLAQFSTGRNSKVAVRAGINNKLNGQITVRTSNSENLSLALAGIIPIVTAIYKKFWPSVGENYSIY